MENRVVLFVSYYWCTAVATGIAKKVFHYLLIQKSLTLCCNSLWNLYGWSKSDYQSQQIVVLYFHVHSFVMWCNFHNQKWFFFFFFFRHLLWFILYPHTCMCVSARARARTHTYNTHQNIHKHMYTHQHQHMHTHTRMHKHTMHTDTSNNTPIESEWCIDALSRKSVSVTVSVCVIQGYCPFPFTGLAPAFWHSVHSAPPPLTPRYRERERKL